MHTYGGRGDVRKVRGDARGVDDVIESKLIDKRAGLQQKRQRLLNRQYVSVYGRGNISHVYTFSSTMKRTWPMPPEAPATTTSKEC